MDTKDVYNFKKVFTILMLVFTMFTSTTLALYSSPVTVYATTNDSGTETKVTDEEQNSDGENFITEYMGEDLINSDVMDFAAALTSPITIMATVITLALMLILLRLFYTQTVIDLIYILIPTTRNWFEQKREGYAQDKKAGGFFKVSDAAEEAVGGGSGSHGGYGGYSGGGESNRRSSLVTYAKAAGAQFILFGIISALILTGKIGDVVVLIFNFITLILDMFTETKWDFISDSTTTS